MGKPATAHARFCTGPDGKGDLGIVAFLSELFEMCDAGGDQGDVVQVCRGLLTPYVRACSPTSAHPARVRNEKDAGEGSDTPISRALPRNLSNRISGLQRVLEHI